MKLPVFALLLSSVFAHAGHDHGEEDVKDPDVVVLTKKTHADFVKKNPLTMIEYYAPWCGHCKALKPEYAAAATILKKLDTPIKIAKVDCTTEDDLCKKADVKGFPTIKVYRDGEAKDFAGQRKTDSIVSFLKKQLLPAVSVVNAKNITKFTDAERVVIVGFFDAAAKKESKVFAGVAESLRDEYVFATSSDAEAAKTAGVKSPAIVVFKKFDDGKAVFEGDESSADEIKSFIGEESLALMDDIGPNNYEKYAERGLPMAFYFVAEQSHREKLGKQIEKLAKEYKGKISFLYLNATTFGGHASNLALKEDSWPAFAIEHAGKKYPADQSKKLTVEVIKKLTDGVLDGSLAPTQKSEPIPESNDGPVKILVGKNFNDIALDSTKDVFVKFYAPWCGHCKAIAPVWEKLGSALDKNSNIVIAKLDATVNDVPTEADIQIQGFPTLVLFKAGSNEHVVFEGGDRNLAGFLKFIKDNAANGADVDVTVAPEEEEAEDDAEEEDHEEL